MTFRVVAAVKPFMRDGIKKKDDAAGKNVSKQQNITYPVTELLIIAAGSNFTQHNVSQINVFWQDFIDCIGLA